MEKWVNECVDCGEPLVIRTNSEGDEFYGCSGFPECRYTENFEDNEPEGWDKNSIKYND